MDGYLPDDIFQPVRDWLEDTAKRDDRRVAVLSQTMSGMLDTFKVRVPRLAAHVDAQVVLRTRLRKELETAYSTALAEFDEGTRGGRLLAGEVLARWQDYAASGDLGSALRGKRTISSARRGGRRTRADAGAARFAALDSALRGALQSLIVSVADRAAEQVARVWRDNPGGAALIAAAEANRARDERAKREFESAFGTVPAGQSPVKQAAFDRSSPDLPLRISRAVSTWQDQLMRLMQRSPFGRPQSSASREDGPLGVVTLVALLGQPSRRGGQPQPAQAMEAENDIVTVPSELLASLIGSAESAELLARARADLEQHVGLLLDEELLRFGEIIDAGRPGRRGRRRPPLPGRVLAGGRAMTSFPSVGQRLGEQNPVPAPRRAGRAGQDRPGPSGPRRGPDVGPGAERRGRARLRQGAPR